MRYSIASLKQSYPNFGVKFSLPSQKPRKSTTLEDDFALACFFGGVKTSLTGFVETKGERERESGDPLHPSFWENNLPQGLRLVKKKKVSPTARRFNNSFLNKCSLLLGRRKKTFPGIASC